MAGRHRGRRVTCRGKSVGFLGILDETVFLIQESHHQPVVTLKLAGTQFDGFHQRFQPLRELSRVRVEGRQRVLLVEERHDD